MTSGSTHRWVDGGRVGPSVAVVVATFGDLPAWDQMAQRAMQSVGEQALPPGVMVRIHGDELHAARNDGAASVDTDWLIFLDADDELDPGYVEAMAAAADNPMCLYQPATLGIVEGREDPHPVVIDPPQRPMTLLDRNFMVIGTMIHADLFRQAGGFRDFPMYEDWDLWLRCWLLGATWQPVPDAVYRVHVRPGSRNQADGKTQLGVYHRIRNEHLPSARAKGLA